MNYDADVLESTYESRFGPLPAGHYDRFQLSKDYQSEVDKITEIFEKEGPVNSVVDLGCGSGRHLELLAEAGCRVVGVDKSPDLVGKARDRLARFGDRASVIEADPFDVALDGPFDAAIMMFSSLGYRVTNEGIRAALTAASEVLRPGGLLLFDTVDGEAVLRARMPSRGLAVIDDAGSQLLCGYFNELTISEQLYRLDLRMWRLDGDRVVERADEAHVIRYFLPRELGLLASISGFELIGTAPLAGPQDPATDWLRLVWVRKAS